MDHCHLYTLYICLLYHILGAHAWDWCEGDEGQRLRAKWMKKSGVRSGGVPLEMVERHDFYNISGGAAVMLQAMPWPQATALLS